MNLSNAYLWGLSFSTIIILCLYIATLFSTKAITNFENVFCRENG